MSERKEPGAESETRSGAAASGVGALEVEELERRLDFVDANRYNGEGASEFQAVAEDAIALCRRLQAERYAEGRGRLAADAECARLRAEVARLRPDARRYAWLRSEDSDLLKTCWGRITEELDASIDEAIAAAGNTEAGDL